MLQQFSFQKAYNSDVVIFCRHETNPKDVITMIYMFDFLFLFLFIILL